MCCEDLTEKKDQIEDITMLIKEEENMMISKLSFENKKIIVLITVQ